MSDPTPVLVVLAGPNGAGKTTFYQLFLEKRAQARKWPFVNADLIAKERFGEEAASRALEAAKLADAERRRLVTNKTSFVMETVFSDQGGAKLAFFREAREAGFRIEVFFIGLESVEESMRRVAARVIDSGHDVPEERLTARYPRTLANLAQLIGMPDRLTIFDNSLDTQPYRLVADFDGGLLSALCSPLPAWMASLDLLSFAHPGTHRFPFPS